MYELGNGNDIDKKQKPDCWVLSLLKTMSTENWLVLIICTWFRNWNRYRVGTGNTQHKVHQTLILDINFIHKAK